MMQRTYKVVPEPIESRSKDLAASLGLPLRGPDMPRLVIGRREWIALPDLAVYPLNAKIDSGARSSSIHAEEVTLSADETMVRFVTVNHYSERIHCESPVARIAKVRSSTGKAKKRIFIETSAVLPGGFRWTILISLANRSEMLSPMLLGRRALAGYFLIDTQGAHLLGPRRQLGKYQIKAPSVDQS
jgi:hypothetical protein